jgi:hypothetical protein
MTLLRTAAAVTATLTLATIGASTLAAPNGSSPSVPQTQNSALPQENVDDATVHKVGAALRQVATIRQQYAQRAQAMDSPEQRQGLTEHARNDMVKAIGDQGLSVQQYQQVIQMAQADESLKQRLLSVAGSGQ